MEMPNQPRKTNKNTSNTRSPHSILRQPAHKNFTKAENTQPATNTQPTQSGFNRPSDHQAQRTTQAQRTQNTQSAHQNPYAVQSTQAQIEGFLQHNQSGALWVATDSVSPFGLSWLNRFTYNRTVLLLIGSTQVGFERISDRDRAAALDFLNRGDVRVATYSGAGGNSTTSGHRTTDGNNSDNRHDTPIPGSDSPLPASAKGWIIVPDAQPSQAAAALIGSPALNTTELLASHSHGRPARVRPASESECRWIYQEMWEAFNRAYDATDNLLNQLRPVQIHPQQQINHTQPVQNPQWQQPAQPTQNPQQPRLHAQRQQHAQRTHQHRSTNSRSINGGEQAVQTPSGWANNNTVDNNTAPPNNKEQEQQTKNANQLNTSGIWDAARTWLMDNRLLAIKVAAGGFGFLFVMFLFTGLMDLIFGGSEPPPAVTSTPTSDTAVSVLTPSTTLPPADTVTVTPTLTAPPTTTVETIIDCPYLTFRGRDACPIMQRVSGVSGTACDALPWEDRPLRLNPNTPQGEVNPARYATALHRSDLVCTWLDENVYTAGEDIPVGDLRAVGAEGAKSCQFTVHPDYDPENPILTQNDYSFVWLTHPVIRLQKGDKIITSGCGWMPATGAVPDPGEELSGDTAGDYPLIVGIDITFGNDGVKYVTCPFSYYEVAEPPDARSWEAALAETTAVYKSAGPAQFTQGVIILNCEGTAENLDKL